MYQSAVDKLKISVDDLLTISDADIIKFEKILKSQLVLNNDNFNAEDNHTTLELLKDVEHRKFIYIIEKHPKLKSFLSNEKSLESKTLSINQSLIDSLKIDTVAFKQFIEPYLKNLLLPRLKEAMKRNKFFFVLDKIKNNWLFTEEIEIQCQQILLNKISVTTAYLKKDKKFKDIKYIKSEGFIELLKLSSYGSNFEYLKNYVETLARQLRSGHPRTKKATFYFEALNAVKKAKTNHEAIDEFIDINSEAHLARAILKKKSPEEWAQQIGLTVMLISVLVISALIFKPSKDKIKVQKNINEYYDAFGQLYSSQITNDAMGVLKSIEANLILKAYEYPYTIKNEISLPLFYPLYETFPKADSTYQNTITIENLDIEKSVIVFRKNQYNHCTLLKPGKQLTTFIAPNDSLIFYRGAQLNVSDFSSPKNPLNGLFKESSKADRKTFFQIYMIDSLHRIKHSKITIDTHGKLNFTDIKTTTKTTSYVGKNFIDVRLLDAYLE